LRCKQDEVYAQKEELAFQNKKIVDQNDELDAKNKLILNQSIHLEKTNKELQKLSIVASETDNIVIIMDKNGKFELTNTAFERFYGRTLEEYINQHSDNIRETSSNPEIKKTIDYIIENKKSKSYQSNIVNKDGEIIWVQTTLTPIIDEITKDIIKLFLLTQI